MDDAFDDLEVELRGMVPMMPSSGLEAAIASELSATRSHVHYVWWALPIAAALALATAQWTTRPTDTPRTRNPTPVVAVTKASLEAFRPVAAENVLLRSEEEGLLTLADGTPARQIRASYVDTITWKNPATNASLKWTVPREEIRVIPLSYQ